MDDSFLQALQATDDPAEKAAIIAEAVFEGLPEELMFIARRCVILHWFDQTVVEALLQDTPIAKSRAEAVYEQLAALPFLEKLAWGLAFQDLTREGLLIRYATKQPNLLRHAAHLAAPLYEA